MKKIIPEHIQTEEDYDRISQEIPEELR